MLGSIIFLVSSGILAPEKKNGAHLGSTYLSVTATCRDNPSCVFSGENLTVDIVIKNESTVDIGYPLQFVTRRGPSLKLIDNKSGEERPLRTNLAPHRLLEEFTIIKPGDSIALDAIISQHTILALSTGQVDLTAEVVPAADIQVNGNLPLVPFHSAAKLRIKAADAVEHVENSDSGLGK
ncbi:hypothetical protein [Pseudoduganella albidiflava]|uniref:Uncharacterized protein n=1 Tax=Pseudoduganella albidiflava TaxID=321983 RepID=A0A411X1A3_9BURK|nr:hypothetical protein [Pseudoduganella albidiflava]QBI02741.1 hypothetical protein EYF70_19215 [Pseudoduganella albidiflava]GGY55914.1 hypothetical protein GCM10007387_42920 [Pseudoduganella albidiflava]